MRSKLQSLDRRKFLAWSGAFCLAGSPPAYASGSSPVTRLSGKALGTKWAVSLPAGSEIISLQAGLEQHLRNADVAFSPWRADGVIANFNRKGTMELNVTEEIADVVRSALLIAEASGGRFDPTVGPLVARWGFGPINSGDALPDGWRAVRVDNNHIGKGRQALTLDLCGIAKGHALDKLTEYLLDAGHEHFLIDLGGELAARGRHPSGRIWQVGIELPLPGSQGLAGLLRLDNTAVATSGDLANGYDLGTRRYSHIIDPATREPVEGRLASVSVLSSSAREADAWATALMAAGEAGPDLAASQSLEALFLMRNGSGLHRVTTGTFDRYFG